jgi:hypothetical protein
MKIYLHPICNSAILIAGRSEQLKGVKIAIRCPHVARIWCRCECSGVQKWYFWCFRCFHSFWPTCNHHSHSGQLIVSHLNKKIVHLWALLPDLPFSLLSDSFHWFCLLWNCFTWPHNRHGANFNVGGCSQNLVRPKIPSNHAYIYFFAQFHPRMPNL